MPNEITKMDGKLDENLLEQKHAVSDSGDKPTKRRKALGDSGMTASVWTLSGVVLAACSAGDVTDAIEDIEDFLGIGGGDDGGSGRAVRVHSSPVQGARIYFDIDEDGDIDAADIALQDAEFPEGFVTDETGQARNIPGKFNDKAFVAVLENAINADTGASLRGEGEYASIPDANNQYTLSSPITDWIDGQMQLQPGATVEQISAEVAALIGRILPDGANDEAQARDFWGQILDHNSYLSGGTVIEALADYLVAEDNPTEAQVKIELTRLFNDADSLVILNDADDPSTPDVVELPAVTIGQHDDYVATVETVSHAGNTRYTIVDANGAPISGGNFAINNRGIITVTDSTGLDTGTRTIYVQINNDDSESDQSEIVSVEVTVQSAVRLSHPANGEGRVTEEVAGAVVLSGIVVGGAVQATDFTIMEGLGVAPGTNNRAMFQFVQGRTPTTWDLKLLDGMELDYESIPGGVIKLRISVEPSSVDRASNILDLVITVEDIPDLAIQGDFIGTITEDESSVSGALTVVNNTNNDLPIPTQGTYGTLTISGGRWTYTLDNNNDAVQALLNGENLQDTITVTVADVSQNIAITISGADEDLTIITASVSPPQISLDNSNFDGNLFLGNILPDLSGQWDANNPVSIAFAGTAPDFFTLSADGDLRFTGTEAQAQQLGASITLNLQISAPDDTTATLPYNLRVIITTDPIDPIDPVDPPEPEPEDPTPTGAVRVFGGDGAVQGAGIYFDAFVGVTGASGYTDIRGAYSLLPDIHPVAIPSHTDDLNGDGFLALHEIASQDLRYGDESDFVTGKGFITGASGYTDILPTALNGMGFEADLTNALDGATGAPLPSVIYRSLPTAGVNHIASPLTDLLVRRAADMGQTLEEVAAELLAAANPSADDIADFLARVVDENSYIGGARPDAQIIGMSQVLFEYSRATGEDYATSDRTTRNILFDLVAKKYNQQAADSASSLDGVVNGLDALDAPAWLTTGFYAATVSVDSGTAPTFDAGTSTWTFDDNATLTFDTAARTFTYTPSASIIAAPDQFLNVPFTITITPTDTTIAPTEVDIRLAYGKERDGTIFYRLNGEQKPYGEDPNTFALNSITETIPIFEPTYAITDAAEYGTFRLDVNNGAWTYDLNESAAAVAALASGSTLTDTIMVAVSVGDTTETRTIEIAITRNGDAYEIASTSTDTSIGGRVFDPNTATTAIDYHFTIDAFDRDVGRIHLLDPTAKDVRFAFPELETITIGGKEIQVLGGLSTARLLDSNQNTIGVFTIDETGFVRFTTADALTPLPIDTYTLTVHVITDTGTTEVKLTIDVSPATPDLILTPSGASISGLVAATELPAWAEAGDYSVTATSDQNTPLGTFTYDEATQTWTYLPVQTPVRGTSVSETVTFTLTPTDTTIAPITQTLKITYGYDLPGGDERWYTLDDGPRMSRAHNDATWSDTFKIPPPIGTSHKLTYSIHENVAGQDADQYLVANENPSAVLDYPLGQADLHAIGADNFDSSQYTIYTPTAIVATIDIGGSQNAPITAADWVIKGAFADKFQMANPNQLATEWQLVLKPGESFNREIIKDGTITLYVGLETDNQVSNTLEFTINVLDLVEGSEITGDLSANLIKDADIDTDSGNLIAEGRITLENKFIGDSAVTIRTDAGTATAVVHDEDANTLTATTRHGTFTYDLATDTWTYSISNNAAAVQSLDDIARLTESIAIEFTLPTGSTYAKTIDINIYGASETLYFIDDAGARISPPSYTDDLLLDGGVSDSVRLPFPPLASSWGGRILASDAEYHLAADTLPAGLGGVFRIDGSTLYFVGSAGDLAAYSDGLTLDILVSGRDVDATPIRYSLALDVVNIVAGAAQEDTAIQYAFPDKAGQVDGVFEAGLVVLDKPIIGGAVAAVELPAWLTAGAYVATFATSKPVAQLSQITFDSATHTWTYAGDGFGIAGSSFSETITFTLTPDASQYPSATAITETLEATLGREANGDHYFIFDGVRVELASNTETYSGTFKSITPTYDIDPDDASEYGVFTLDTDTGAWSYDLDTTIREVANLAAGAELTETITVTGTAAGTETDRTITITIGRDADGFTLTSTGSTTTETQKITIPRGVNVQIDTDSGTAEEVEVSVLGGAVNAVESTATPPTDFSTVTGTATATLGTIASVNGGGNGFLSYRLNTADRPEIGEEVTESITVTLTPTGGGTDFVGVIDVIFGRDANGYYHDLGDGVRVPFVPNLNVTFAIDFPTIYTVTDGAEYGTFNFNRGSRDWTYALNYYNGLVAGMQIGATLTDTIIITGSVNGTKETRTIDITITRNADSYDIATTSTDTTSYAAGYIIRGKYGTMEYDAIGNSWNYELDHSDPDTIAVVETLAAQGWVYGDLTGDLLTQIQADERLAEIIVFEYTDQNGARQTAEVPIIYNRPDLTYIEASGNLNPIFADFETQTPAAQTGTINHGIPTADITDITILTNSELSGTVNAVVVAPYTATSADAESGATVAVDTTAHTITYTPSSGRLLTSGGTFNDPFTVTITPSGGGDPFDVEIDLWIGQRNSGESFFALSNTDDLSLHIPYEGEDPLTLELKPLTFTIPGFTSSSYTITDAAEYGTLTIDADTLKWDYDFNEAHAAVVALAVGDTLTDTIIVTGSQMLADDVTTTITIKITRDADGFTFTDATDTEIATPSDAEAVSYIRIATDFSSSLRNGDFRATVAEDGNGNTRTHIVENDVEYGTLSFSLDKGRWEYILDSTNDAVANLAIGDTLTDDFALLITPPGEQVPVTVRETFTISRDQHGVFFADANGARINPIPTDKTTITAEGEYGTLTYNVASGAWQYNIDEDDPDTIALGNANVPGETFILQITNADGTITEETIYTADYAIGVSANEILIDFSTDDASKTLLISAKSTPGGTTSTLPGVMLTYTPADGSDPITKTFTLTVNYNFSTQGFTYNIGGQSASGIGTDFVATFNFLDFFPEVTPTIPRYRDPSVTILTTFYNDDAAVKSFVNPIQAPQTADPILFGQPVAYDTILDAYFTIGTDGEFYETTLNADGTIATTATTPWAGDTPENYHIIGGNVITTAENAAENLLIATTSYGNFEYNTETRDWRFIVDNNDPDIQALGGDDTITETIMLQFTHADGTTTTETITITINGTEEEIYFVDADGNRLDEIPADLGQTTTTEIRRTATFQGQVDAVTPQPGADYTVKINGDLSAGATLTFDTETNTWTYTNPTLNYAKVNDMVNSESVTLTITPTTGDSTTPITVPFELQIKDPLLHDGPFRSSPYYDFNGELTEILNLPGRGGVGTLIPITDAIPGLEPIYTATSGDYGSFNIDPTTGAWTYTLYNGVDAVENLGINASLTDIITVTAHHKFGGTTTEDIAITIRRDDDGIYFEQLVPTSPLTGLLDVITPVPGGSGYDAELIFHRNDIINNGIQGSVAFDETAHTFTWTAPDGYLFSGQLTDWFIFKLTPTGGDDPVEIKVAFIIGSHDGLHYQVQGLGNVFDADVVSYADNGDLNPVTLPIPGLIRYDTTTLGSYGSVEVVSDSREWFYRIDAGNADVANLAIGEILTDTITINGQHIFDGAAVTQTITVRIGRDADGIFYADENGARVGFAPLDGTLLSSIFLRDFDHAGSYYADDEDVRIPGEGADYTDSFTFDRIYFPHDASYTVTHTEFYFQLADIERGDVGAALTSGIILGNVLPEIGGDIDLNNVRVDFADSVSDTIKSLFWVSRDGTLSLAVDAGITSIGAINQALTELEDQLTLDLVISAPRDTAITLPYRVTVNFVDEVNNDKTPDMDVVIEQQVEVEITASGADDGTFTISDDGKSWSYVLDNAVLSGTFVAEDITLTIKPEGGVAYTETFTLLISNTTINNGYAYTIRDETSQTVVSATSIASYNTPIIGTFGLPAPPHIDLTQGGHLATISYYDADAYTGDIAFGLLPDSSTDDNGNIIYSGGMDAATYAAHLALLTIDEDSGQIHLQDRPPIQNPQDFRVVATVTDNGVRVAREILTIDVDGNGINLPPTFLDDDITLNLNEGATKTSAGIITTLIAVDTTPVTYAITAGNDAGLFTINGNNGRIRLAENAKLDYDTAESHTLTITASSNGGTATATVTINVIDRNEGEAGYAILQNGDMLELQQAFTDPDGVRAAPTPIYSWLPTPPPDISYQWFTTTDGGKTKTLLGEAIEVKASDDETNAIKTSYDTTNTPAVFTSYAFHVIQAADGVLTVTADGAWSYTRNAELPMDRSDQERITIRISPEGTNEIFDRVVNLEITRDSSGDYTYTPGGETTRIPLATYNTPITGTIPLPTHPAGTVHGVTVSYTDNAGVEYDIDVLEPITPFTDRHGINNFAFYTGSINEDGTDDMLPAQLGTGGLPIGFSGVVEWRLVNDVGELVRELHGFSINDQTGGISLKTGTTLDYETTPTYNLRVRAIYNDGRGPLEEDLHIETWVIINVLDANERAPELGEVQIVENSGAIAGVNLEVRGDGDDILAMLGARTLLGLLSAPTISGTTVTGTAIAEYIRGGTGDDTITSGGGADHIIGGAGDDGITLASDAGSVETIYYRFSTAGTIWTSPDGTDTITNFRRGEDRLVFLDTDGTPIDLMTFTHADNVRTTGGQLAVKPILANDEVEGVEVIFGTNKIRVEFHDSSHEVYRIYDSVADGYDYTEASKKYLGQFDGDGVPSGFLFHISTLKDNTLLPNYFNVTSADVLISERRRHDDGVFATISATDDDASAPNNEIASYDITGGNDLGLFAIDDDGGISVAEGKGFNTEGTALTYTLTITATDSGGTPMTSAAKTITIGVEVDHLSVYDISKSGNTLTATQNTEDSDGEVAASVRYQWFTTDGTSINRLGTLSSTNTLDTAASGNELPTGSVYGVTITYNDEAGNMGETVTIVQGILDGGVADENLDGDATTNYIVGGLGIDTIDGKGGNDHIWGGEGNDIIKLTEAEGSVETIYYAFTSTDTGAWTTTDGMDAITNFRRGEDRLIFVDEDETVITMTEFLNDANRMSDNLEVTPLFSMDKTTLTGVQIDFGDSTALTINYATASQVTVRAANQGAWEAAATKYVGANGANLGDDGILTNNALLRNYFGADGNTNIQILDDEMIVIVDLI